MRARVIESKRAKERGERKRRERGVSEIKREERVNGKEIYTERDRQKGKERTGRERESK